MILMLWNLLDVLTNITKGIESATNGLGGLKGVLGIVTPMLMNLLSTNIGSFIG